MEQQTNSVDHLVENSQCGTLHIQTHLPHLRHDQRTDACRNPRSEPERQNCSQQGCDLSVPRVPRRATNSAFRPALHAFPAKIRGSRKCSQELIKALHTVKSHGLQRILKILTVGSWLNILFLIFHHIVGTSKDDCSR